MSDIAIQVKNLSKRYRIGLVDKRQDTLAGVITGFVRNPLRNFRNLQRLTHFDDDNSPDILWALKDVSFDVHRGEVVGIIGRNGAGKSTLLKILSRITFPSSGRVTLSGRVASLLEVGTGFHKELTGRENIFLNGTILGMTRTEVAHKFDEIVDFSGVEKFIDTPVKHYSSGMRVRLAFSVAAHLNPEILLVDEVLAVGDAEFQKKCLGKMGAVASEGRTILFVSHNMGAVNSLCERTLCLDKGQILMDGLSSDVISDYLAQGSSVTGQKNWTENERPGNQSYQLLSVSFKNAAGEVTNKIDISEEGIIEIVYEVLEDGVRPHFSLSLYTSRGDIVFSSKSNTRENILHSKLLPVGCYTVRCRIYKHLLNNEHYQISLACASEYWQDRFLVENILTFEAIDDGITRGDYSGRIGGLVRPYLVWETDKS